MAESSIVKRMAAFIEHIYEVRGGVPQSIVITEQQLKELQAETDTPRSIAERKRCKEEGIETTYEFWGVPLKISGDKDGKSSIESH